MLAVTLVSSLAASESQRHYHGGKLSRYEIGPPALLLSSSDETRLRTGRSVLQTVAADDGETQRLIMVQDIQAPAHVVLGRIMDVNKYAEMVSGCDRSVVYANGEQGGQQVVKSEYEIHALHMHFTYFVTHIYDPAQRCMVFHLDYDRRSDLDDTVGYWYVDPKGRSSCRVFYSCECKLRGWVPGPVYNMMTKEAVKKATTWVEREAMKELRASRQGGFRFNGQALGRLADGVREALAAQAAKLPPPPQLPPLPPLPQMPWLPHQPQRQAADWLAERRLTASRFGLSSVRAREAAS